MRGIFWHIVSQFLNFLIFFFRYIQIIVIRLHNSALPDPPYLFTSDNISTVNESVPTLKPYITAQLTVDQANELKTFVIGDGLNYGESSRRRQRVEKSNETRDRSYMSPKATFFYNRPLEADSNYSAFQRTFIEEDTYYSSSWLEPVKTRMTETEISGEISSGS
ncbi:Hypothetical predicted protein, partial [Paramuricea clavata]